ncbi:MAG: hypothetical protein R3C49_02880 [Planctomycetaceae bacterium]
MAGDAQGIGTITDNDIVDLSQRMTSPSTKSAGTLTFTITADQAPAAV